MGGSTSAHRAWGCSARRCLYKATLLAAPAPQAVAERPAPWQKLHAVYGAVELAKVGLLGAWIWQLVGAA